MSLSALQKSFNLIRQSMRLSICQRIFALTVFVLSVVPIAQAQYKPITDPVILQHVDKKHGENLFQQHCASCHGQKAQGVVDNWQIIGQDGKYPPPPLNGTAHAWHHSIAGLAHTIKNGTLIIGGNMPPWKDTLSDDDIFAIIAWISSLWADEIYTVWRQRNGG